MSDRPIVIKYGGSLLEDPVHRREFLKDVAELSRKKKVVLIHGGGKEITRTLKQLDIESRFDVNGRRMTDDKTMKVVDQVLGQVNKVLVDELNVHNANARGFSGKENRLATARPLAHLGRVGDPATLDINEKALEDVLMRAKLPVFYSVGVDAKGDPLNINADDFAQALAIACRAQRLVFLTDVGGVLDENGKAVSTIAASDVEKLVAQKIISGGMVVKAQACLQAMNEGVGCVDIRKGIKDLLKGVTVSNEGTVFIR